MSRNVMIRGLLGAILASALPAAVLAQGRARIDGTVIGPSGQPQANVAIVVTNAEGTERRGVSDASGAFVFGGLQPGTYRLRTDDQAFAPFTQDQIALTAGQTVTLRIVLQAGGPSPVTPAQAPTPPAPTPPPAPPAAAAPPAPGGVPSVTAPGGEFEAEPNRWAFKFPPYTRYSLPQPLPWVVGRPLDPYNQNPAKADFPIAGNDLFLNLNLQLNSQVNPRQVGAVSPLSQIFFNDNFVGGVELFRGDTVFQPKVWAVRATVVGNVNALAFTGKSTTTGSTYGVEEAFAERRLAVLSPAFDFVSVRAGMQNFNSDFRGYLFVDNQLGVRVFGNARSNRDQYNAAYFSMRDRDPTSQLHRIEKSRQQDVFIANYFIQDFIASGYTAMVNVHLNRDRLSSANPLTPQTGELQVVYVGFHGDGKWGAWSLSHAFYQAFGTDDDNVIARKLSADPTRPHAVDINAQMAAVEISRDADWRRYRVSAFYASGDNRSDPTKARGFDSITDNPNLAGGQFMYWTQQASKTAGLPLGGVLSEKFSLLANLRSKFTDRANFVNPGLMLLNAGTDFRVSPQLKLVTNASYLRFADASVLRDLVGPGKGFENEEIGVDLSTGAKYRPFVNENLFVVLGFSTLIPRGGFQTALGSDNHLYSVVGAIQLAY